MIKSSWTDRTHPCIRCIAECYLSRLLTRAPSMIALSCSNTRCCSFLKPVIPNRWTSRRAWNKQTVVKVTFKLEKDNLFNNLSPFPSWVPPVGHFVSSLISVGSWWDGVIKPTTDRKNRAFVHRFITLLQQLPKDLNWKKAKLWEK